MSHDANASRTHLDRRRRRLLAGALLGLVLLAGIAWLVRNDWMPGRGRATVVAEDGDATATDTSAARSTAASTTDGGARLGRRGGDSRPERSPAHPTDEAIRTSRPPEEVKPPSPEVASSAATPAQALPEYRADATLRGELTSVGSDTLNNLMLDLATGFGKRHPDVRTHVEGKGSSTAPPALTAGIADLGPMTREMTEAEIAAFKARFGYPPTANCVAFEALAIYVHKENPIPHLTLAQADAIFSTSRMRAAPSDVATWGQLGLTGVWADRTISLFGSNSASTSYGYFGQRILAKGGWRSTVKEQPSGAAVVAGVAGDLKSCGYGDVNYLTAGVRAVPIIGDDGPPTEPDEANIRSLRYPMSRRLWIHVNRAPNRPLAAIVEAFLRFALSRTGQDAAAKSGFAKLSAEIAATERAMAD